MLMRATIAATLIIATPAVAQDTYVHSTLTPCPVAKTKVRVKLVTRPPERREPLKLYFAYRCFPESRR